LADVIKFNDYGTTEQRIKILDMDEQRTEI
jgi:hypothetical protein